MNSIEQYVGKSINCTCGRSHKSHVEKIVISPDAIEVDLINFIIENNYRLVNVVCGPNGYEIAGKRIVEAFENNKIAYSLHKFSTANIVPDEYSIGNLAMGCNLDCDLFLAVGSGTINDLTRYISAVAGKPFCTVGTAPSMDGYVSGGSALVFNHTKVNFETHAPQATFFLPSILAEAPLDMRASGAGDLLGKISCLNDWKLSRIINDEWYCDFIVDIVNTAITKVIDNSKGLVDGTEEACSALIEALLLSGVCMDFAGNSRPASGCEHHISHFWEMRYLLEGREAVFHGTKVGIGTIISLKAYDYVSKLNPDFKTLKTIERQSYSDWEKEIKNAYMSASDSIINLEKKSGKNDFSSLAKRLVVIEEKWDEIKQHASSSIKPDLVKGILSAMGAPTSPLEIGVEREMARQAIMYAKEIRNRYTVLQLLWDLSELDNFTEMVLSELYK